MPLLPGKPVAAEGFADAAIRGAPAFGPLKFFPRPLKAADFLFWD